MCRGDLRQPRKSAAEEMTGLLLRDFNLLTHGKLGEVDTWIQLYDGLVLQPPFLAIFQGLSPL